jgi:hypothetical protein
MLQDDDGRSSGGSSPESTGSVETSISSHFGGMNYPSLFSSRPSGYGVSQQSVCSHIHILTPFFIVLTLLSLLL